MPIDRGWPDDPIDDAQKRIAELEAAIQHVVDVLDSAKWRSLFERVAILAPDILMQDMPRVDMVRLRRLDARRNPLAGA